MMQGDDIRNQRIRAEKDANFDEPITNPSYLPAQTNLALWVIAEQLFELRSLLGVVIDRDRKEVNIFVNGGAVEATGGK